MRLKAVVNYRPWGHVLHDSLGLVLLAMMLISHGSTRYYEQSIMLEALSSLALALVVFSTCQLFVAVKNNAIGRTTALWAGSLVGLSMFANSFNPRFSPLVVLSLVVAVSSLRLARVPLRFSAAAIAVPLLLSLPLLILPQRVLNQTHKWNSTFISMHALFMHARLVLPEIARDRDDPSFTRYDRKYLGELSNLIQQELDRADREGPGGNYTLNYDPNRLLWGPANDGLRAYAKDSPEFFHKFCQYYFTQALLHNPWGYAKKVALEWWYLLRPSGPILDDSWAPVPLATEFKNSAPYAAYYIGQARPEVRSIFISYHKLVEEEANRSTVVLSTPPPLDRIGSLATRIHFPAWIILFGFAAWQIRRSSVQTGLAGLAIAFIGVSILLIGQLAPLAMVTTTCGGRAIQGLRVLTALTTVGMGLLGALFVAHLGRGLHLLVAKPD
jgi:hypothetical protein